MYLCKRSISLLFCEVFEKSMLEKVERVDKHCVENTVFVLVCECVKILDQSKGHAFMQDIRYMTIEDTGFE